MRQLLGAPLPEPKVDGIRQAGAQAREGGGVRALGEDAAWYGPRVEAQLGELALQETLDPG
jgi:hypothetical protein